MTTMRGFLPPFLLALVLTAVACGGGATTPTLTDAIPGDESPAETVGTDAIGPDGATADAERTDTPLGDPNATDLVTPDPGAPDEGWSDEGAVDASDDAATGKDGKGKDGGGKDGGKDSTSKNYPTIYPTPVSDWGCGDPAVFNIVLGRPTDTSITASVAADAGTEVFCEFGTSPGSFTGKTATGTSADGEPVESELTGLKADTPYFYRCNCRPAGGTDYVASDVHSFHTRRAAGSTFSFGLQGDSHPERLGNMFGPDLYVRNMQNVAARQPDFYFGLGDDFSIDPLLDGNTLTQNNVTQVYRDQRGFFGIPGHSAPIFLVNGNHEQASGYLLTPQFPTAFANAPILAGKTRVTWYALPAPGGMYTGDTEEIAGVGLPRDYYAFEWGDALFVTLDPYWHSPVPVDNGVPGVNKTSDTWLNTIGDAQYTWFKQTLEGSQARYKFVFAHHVLGTGRGGAAIAGTYEWGGYAADGKTWAFDSKRPTWARPMHQLMNDNHVTIFFFGHDHCFAREKVDGVVYQSVANPADDTYSAFNSDAYAPASIPFPGAVYDASYGVVQANSGFLNVTVSPQNVTVDYIRAVLPGDEAAAGTTNGATSFSYTVTAD